MNDILKYGSLALSGAIGGVVGKYVGSDWGMYIGSAVSGAISLFVGRLLHNTPVPEKK